VPVAGEKQTPFSRLLQLFKKGEEELLSKSAASAATADVRVINVLVQLLNDRASMLWRASSTSLGLRGSLEAAFELVEEIEETFTVLSHRLAKVEVIVAAGSKRSASFTFATRALLAQLKRVLRSVLKSLKLRVDVFISTQIAATVRKHYDKLLLISPHFDQLFCPMEGQEEEDISENQLHQLTQHEGKEEQQQQALVAGGGKSGDTQLFLVEQVLQCIVLDVTKSFSLSPPVASSLLSLALACILRQAFVCILQKRLGFNTQGIRFLFTNVMQLKQWASEAKARHTVLSSLPSGSKLLQDQSSWLYAQDVLQLLMAADVSGKCPIRETQSLLTTNEHARWAALVLEPFSSSSPSSSSFGNCCCLLFSSSSSSSSWSRRREKTTKHRSATVFVNMIIDVDAL